MDRLYRSRRDKPIAAAFGHLFTSLGVVIAMFAIFAAVEGRWIDMFVWLGIALIVDGIDGPVARHLNLAKTLPRWSGDVLDLVVDYLTYIFIPAIAVLQAGLEIQAATSRAIREEENGCGSPHSQDRRPGSAHL
jgi:phosphatidylcholine synthase